MNIMARKYGTGGRKGTEHYKGHPGERPPEKSKNQTQSTVKIK